MHLQNLSLSTYFPRADSYPSGDFGMVCEARVAPPQPFPFQERHLQCAWIDPRFRPRHLIASDGTPIEVEHPGEWNLEAGPDFINTILRIGKNRRQVCGDTEIHIHANAWNQHGHGDDPRYDHVRFHVVYFPGPEIPGLIQIPLQPLLESDPGFSFDNIDTTAYPYALPTGTHPLKGLPPDDKTYLLECAGEQRLRLKAGRMVAELASKDPGQLLWEELMGALGFKNNKQAFRQLARELPLQTLLALAGNPSEAYALLLGLAGLLPTNPDPAWSDDARTFVRSLWDYWWRQREETKERVPNKPQWNLAGIRPINHPVRRLMAAAHYAFRIPALIHDTSLLISFPDNFWRRHLTWKVECEEIALVGTSRANAMVTNVLAPYCAAAGIEGIDLSHLAPEPSNSIIRQTAHALFGPDHAPAIYRSALARQGLIQIFHDYLIPHRLDELESYCTRALEQGPALPTA